MKIKMNNFCLKSVRELNFASMYFFLNSVMCIKNANCYQY